jgi:integrase
VCPIRCISSRVLAPDEAANVLPVWRRSWNRKPSGSPASATHSAQRTDRWKLFRRNAAPFGRLKISSSGSVDGNLARCSRTTATSAEGKATVRKPENPCRMRGFDKEPTSERPTASVDQVWRLAALMPGRFQALVIFAAFTALRWGELVSLRVRDVDLDTGVDRVTSRAQRHWSNASVD